MGIIWFLFPIAFAADADCLDLSPNVTDEECGNLDIMVQYFDMNGNCSQALFDEKFDSFDLSFATVYGETYTSIWQKQKERVWLVARNVAELKFQDGDIADRVLNITSETNKLLETRFSELTTGLQDSIQSVIENQEKHKIILEEVDQRLSEARGALHNLQETMNGFSKLHNLYVTLRAQSNRAHRCNAELQRVSESLMLSGVGKDGEKILEDCKDLLDENLTQKLLESSAVYCSSAEEMRSGRSLSSNGLPLVEDVQYLTMAECLKETNYPNFRAGRTYENEDAHRLQQDKFALIDQIMLQECNAFSRYLKQYLLRRSGELMKENSDRLVESMKNIEHQSSTIDESMQACGSEARSIYRKFKVNAELFAKGQACGRKMTKRWSVHVEKCLKANAWTKVWLPWYNIPHLFGDENNCVKTRNLILSGMITAMSSVVIFFVVIWCLRCACACSCRWLRCRKSHGSRKRTNKRETKQTDGRTDQASNEGTKCTRTRTRPSKKDVLATVLENTRYHPSSDAASMSTNDHSSLVSDHSEFSRETNLYQPAVHPRTDYSSSSGYERNGRRSVASESSANSGRQPNESDLEAPALFYLPNLLPNNVISPPTLITLPHIRPSTDSAARIAVPFTPHLGFAPQGAVQPPFGALPPACRTSTRSRTVPSYLTPPNSPAPTSLTTSTPAPSGHVARSTTRHQTAFISRP